MSWSPPGWASCMILALSSNDQCRHSGFSGAGLRDEGILGDEQPHLAKQCTQHRPTNPGIYLYSCCNGISFKSISGSE